MLQQDTLRIIADIHGNYKAFKRLVDEGLHNNCFFILLGDIIGKGPNSLATMKLATELVEKEKAKIVLGNWEKAFIAFYNGKTHLKHYETEILKINQQIKDAGEEGLNVLDRFLTVLENSYPWIVMGKRKFVHAVWHDEFIKYGVSPKFNELTTLEAKNYFGRACTGQSNYKENADYEYHGICWDWLDKQKEGEIFYTGHISVTEVTEVVGKHGAIAYMLDTGSGKNGDLSSYDIILRK